MNNWWSIIYQLASDDGDFPNSLHEGVRGFHSRIFKAIFLAMLDYPSLIFKIFEPWCCGSVSWKFRCFNELQINSNYITPVNEFLNPPGEFKDINGTMYDFNSPRILLNF